MELPVQNCRAAFRTFHKHQPLKALRCHSAAYSPFWVGWGGGVGCTRCQHAQWKWYSFLYQSITQHLHVEQLGSICSLAEVQVGGPSRCWVPHSCTTTTTQNVSCRTCNCSQNCLGKLHLRLVLPDITLLLVAINLMRTLLFPITTNPLLNIPLNILFLIEIFSGARYLD